ncbi:zinc transport system substrate-binding protein [Natronincola peptidivorans]|uniref:Zinc transport system substrate-binding protein n=1 Tax=Natronincola peptidivorans TaxID=426128 RepID=A0A1I0DA92_9FIRM|nr:zinc ABC transporter substrate-binding protein [Natronincola peptidivorans]SET28596.1 zinc transport system substrate-binding protein [Natronincola peptidivorans]
MKKTILKYGVFLMILTMVVTGCTPAASTEEEDSQEIAAEIIEKDPIKVFASFYPFYDFAKKVGGDLADVQVVVSEGADPHSFEPSPRLIADIEAADVFIYNGLGMEPWVDGVLEILKNKDVIIIEASEGLELIKFDDHDHDHDHHHHDHEDHHHHDQGEYDPHIWVDPINAKDISEKIKDAFVKIDAENTDNYEESFSMFQKDLEALDKAFREALENIQEKKMLVSHSAFGYLANRYGIEEIAVAGVSPHAEPSPGRLAELTKKARENNLEYIFFEVLANPKTAEVLANEADLKPLILYNMEGLTKELREAGEDYVSLMYKNLETLKKALVK